jgi:ribosomal protein L21
VVDAIGAVAAAELAKSIGLVDAKTSNNYGKKGKAPTTSSSKKSLKDSSSSGSVDSGSGSDSEGGPIIDVAGGGKSGSGSSSSSSSSTSSGGSSSSSSGDNSPSSSSSAGSSGSEAMGPVRIVSTTESSSASASSGGGSSSEGNDGTPSTALTIASKSKSGEKISQSGLEGWRANLEQRRARGRLTETEKKARERAILALSLNFPSAAAASSSSSSPPSSSSLPQLFAIISLAGKQFKVSPGDIVIADRLKNVAVATELALSPHIVGSPTTTIVGRPVVQGASVMCVVESHELDEKVIVFKKKRRKRYQRTQGHRREISRIRIDKIVCDVSAY